MAGLWSYLHALEEWLKNASAIITLGTLIVNAFTFGAATKATIRIKHLEGTIDSLKAEIATKDDDIQIIDRLAVLVQAIRNLHHVDLLKNLDDKTITKIRAALTIPEDEEFFGVLAHKRWGTTYMAFTDQGIHLLGQERIAWEEFVTMDIQLIDANALNLGDIHITRKTAAYSYVKLLRELQDQLRRHGLPSTAPSQAAA